MPRGFNMIYHLMMILSLCFLTGCQSFNKLIGIPNDNPIENMAEVAIESITNVKVDLTPEFLDYPEDSESKH